ncbi:MAG: hypothetical protein ACAI25_20925 [Planctomycetota bacterium]
MDLSALFPGRETTSHPPPRDDLPLAKFEVVHVAPSGDEPHVYVTQGASEHGHEFLLYTPKSDPWFIDVLTSVSYYQSFYGLELGQTYKFARGWLPGSQLNRLLLHSERVGDFVRLVPITEDEEKLVKSQGAPALEARLQGADLLAVDRAPVA